MNVGFDGYDMDAINPPFILKSPMVPDPKYVVSSPTQPWFLGGFSYERGKGVPFNVDKWIT